MPPTIRVVFCQRCGKGQQIAGSSEVQPCGCGGLHFHTQHPRERMPLWQSPNLMTREDRLFLRSLNIAPV